MSIHDILQSVGIDPTVLYAGASGGLIRALSQKRYNLRQMVASPICGALSAAYLTLPVVHYIRSTGLPMPDDGQAVMSFAFLIGVCGMQLSDLILAFVAKKMKISGE